MTLLSLNFFAFLSVSAAVYYLIPLRSRVFVLSFISALFYLFLGFLPFVCIMSMTALSYFLALESRRRKGAYLFASVGIITVFWLCVRVMSEINGILIPIGLSFYTLRIISYVSDVARGRVKAEKSFVRYMLFTAFFPIAFMGPIAQYSESAKAMLVPNKASWENISGGILRMLFGVFKKTVIADALAEPVRKISSEPESFFGVYVLILIVLYSVEAYFDFSGGIDIALGAARVFGVRMPENFNKPFSSKTLAEFWNRWHITLGEWFEHYVFYPISLAKPMQRLSRNLRKRLGAKPGKRIPVYLSTLLTWILTGLWHGGAPHFVLWGLINGILVLISAECSRVMSRLCERNPNALKFRDKIAFLAPVRVFFVIGAVRLLDVYKDVPLTFKMLASIVTRPESYVGLSENAVGLISVSALIPIVVGMAVAFAVSRLEIDSEKVCKRPYVFATCATLLMLSSLLFGNYGYGFNASDFIYSQF